jgi:hypothetical protein
VGLPLGLRAKCILAKRGIEADALVFLPRPGPLTGLRGTDRSRRGGRTTSLRADAENLSTDGSLSQRQWSVHKELVCIGQGTSV